MEKRLQEEREKVLLANLKSQEEATTAARVEASIKDLQDKLRRDRRDQEQEEARAKLEAKVAELEARLAQERETWVSTLKDQMQTREAQDKELESHFTLRIQEMERRWLEEKAHWQKTNLAKDEELRNLRSLAEKLKGIEVEWSRLGAEKKTLEARVTELSQERSEAVGKLGSALEKEKENIQLRGDITLARQQLTMVQERLERELHVLRATSKEREDRLMAENERLSRELMTLGTKLAAENEAEIRRVRLLNEQDTEKIKAAAAKSEEEITRLRAVCGALEKQVATYRLQLEGLQKGTAEWQKTQERYKAEFMVLQRRWAEREREIRREFEQEFNRLLEAEKVKARAELQEDFNRRLGQLKEEWGVEKEQLLRESELRATRRKADLEKELVQKEAHQESVLLELRSRAEELTSRLAHEEESRKLGAEDRLQVEKLLQAAREEIGQLKLELSQARAESDELSRERDVMGSEKSNVERRAMAQAAEIKNIHDTLSLVRQTLSREEGMARYDKFIVEIQNRLAGLE